MKEHYLPEQIRNIAVIAHIDHGKTTLLDSLFRQSEIFRENQDVPERLMDHHDQEKERGITIFAKHAAIAFNDFKINIIDTPGHADFSGEVERILGMVNCVLLLVDAQEGPMPQTRFVLSKSLEKGLKPIVVINKIDKPNATPDKALNQTFDLFVELGANDEQLDFSYCYAAGLAGYAMHHLDDPQTDMRPLLELVTKDAPAPQGDIEDTFAMQIATIDYNDYVGRQGCGRILNGSVKKGQTVTMIDRDGKETRQQITKVECFHGMETVEVESAQAGDIVLVSGIPNITIGDTLCDPSNIVHLPKIEIDEATLAVELRVNDSPFVGKSGKNVTYNKIKARLEREQLANPSLQIDTETSNEMCTVAGRGELHLSVLLESMRREGYECSISQPTVVTKQIDGVKHEPIERVHIETPAEHSGGVIEALSRRRGEMQHLDTDEHDICRMQFLVPTRGLIGFRQNFITMTRGLGILTSILDQYVPWKGDIPGRGKGVLVSMCPGRTNSYACFTLQDRGTLFVSPGDEVYEGMVVGENTRDNDLVVNITKPKQLTNVRASGTDESIILTPPKKLTLEQAIDYIASDEWIEITPDVIRLRKRYLTENERKRKK